MSYKDALLKSKTYKPHHIPSSATVSHQWHEVQSRKDDRIQRSVWSRLGSVRRSIQDNRSGTGGVWNRLQPGLREGHLLALLKAKAGHRCFNCLASDHQIAHCRDPPPPSVSCAHGSATRQGSARRRSGWKPGVRRGVRQERRVKKKGSGSGKVSGGWISLNLFRERRSIALSWWWLVRRRPRKSEMQSASANCMPSWECRLMLVSRLELATWPGMFDSSFTSWTTQGAGYGPGLLQPQFRLTEAEELGAGDARHPGREHGPAPYAMVQAGACCCRLSALLGKSLLGRSPKSCPQFGLGNSAFQSSFIHR